MLTLLIILYIIGGFFTYVIARTLMKASKIELWFVTIFWPLFLLGFGIMLLIADLKNKL